MYLISIVVCEFSVGKMILIIGTILVSIIVVLLVVLRVAIQFSEVLYQVVSQPG